MQCCRTLFRLTRIASLVDGLKVRHFSLPHTALHIIPCILALHFVLFIRSLLPRRCCCNLCERCTCNSLSDCPGMLHVMVTRNTARSLPNRVFAAPQCLRRAFRAITTFPSVTSTSTTFLSPLYPSMASATGPGLGVEIVQIVNRLQARLNHFCQIRVALIVRPEIGCFQHRWDNSLRH